MEKENWTDWESLLKTDDMEIAPDFFDYFEAAAALLEKDKYVMNEIKISLFSFGVFQSTKNEMRSFPPFSPSCY